MVVDKCMQIYLLECITQENYRNLSIRQTLNLFVFKKEVRLLVLD